MFHKNANITFELTIPGAAEQKTVDYNVTVENMDKDAPKDAKVYWRFLENGEVQEGNTLDISNLEDQSTTDGIEVWIASESEDLYAANGKELKHTFLYSENMERSYTFEYSDECGNEGAPITVTLPDELNMKPYEAPVEEEGAYEKTQHLRKSLRKSMRSMTDWQVISVPGHRQKMLLPNWQKRSDTAAVIRFLIPFLMTAGRN